MICRGIQAVPPMVSPVLAAAEPVHTAAAAEWVQVWAIAVSDKVTNLMSALLRKKAAIEENRTGLRSG